jgi:group I intron endonuclease
MVVYKITNKIDGKSYIGKTIGDVEKRFQRHCRPSSRCPKIRNAIQKYGKVNFDLEIIDIAQNEIELNKKEIYWISYYNTYEEGYNLSFGGDGGTISKKSIEKIRQHRLGSKTSDSVKKKMSEMRKGHRNSNAKRVAVTGPNEFYMEYDCLTYASEDLDIKYSAARAVAQGYNKKTRSGLVFKYLEQ